VVAAARVDAEDEGGVDGLVEAGGGFGLESFFFFFRCKRSRSRSVRRVEFFDCFLPLFSLLLFARFLLDFAHLHGSDRGLQIELQDGGASWPHHERGSRQGRVVELDGDFVIRDDIGVFGSGGGLMVNFSRRE